MRHIHVRTSTIGILIAFPIAWALMPLKDAIVRALFGGGPSDMSVIGWTLLLGGLAIMGLGLTQ